MNLLPAILSLALLTMTLNAQDEIPLWPGDAPGAKGHESKDTPTLTYYPADSGKASGAAMVICPGGGYGGLAAHEGEGYAKWLADNGIACFVLKYRLGSAGYRHPVMLNDAARAIRWVKAKAADYKVDANRVGIIGSSAGGHLASTILTHFDDGKPDSEDVIERQSSRPALGILCYAVITMGPNTHGGSKQNLLGKDPAPELVELLSNEKQVTKNTPPCFIWHTFEDQAVKVENSLAFADALAKAKVPFDLHIYQKGGHGIGLGTKDNDKTKYHPWSADCIYWLKVQKFVK